MFSLGVCSVPGLGEWRSVPAVFRDGQLGQHVRPEEHEARAGRDPDPREQRQGPHRLQVRKKLIEKSLQFIFRRRSI